MLESSASQVFVQSIMLSILDSEMGDLLPATPFDIAFMDVEALAML